MSAVEALRRYRERAATYDDPAVVVGEPPAGWLDDVAARIDAAPAEQVPLRGTTFAIKDNIDLAGTPTTVACPQIATTPTESAVVVDRLIEAGALPVAKVNLDQFATGLVGVRSPFGTPRNPFDPALVPGGSSSGSGVAVATGLVDFALGTDTAGSGRVPAAMCGISSVKPTPGWLSCTGSVPAVRSIDCIAVFAGDLELAGRVTAIAAGFDPHDPFSRAHPGIGSKPVQRVGVVALDVLETLGVDPAIVSAYAELPARLDALDIASVEIDPAPLFEAGDQLYGGPWLTERALAVSEVGPPTDAIDPAVAMILAGADQHSVADLHRARYRLGQLRHDTAVIFEDVDAIALPTIGWWVTKDELRQDPIAPNVRLGRFTTFTNLLDLCTVTVPIGGEVPGRPPVSLSLHGPAWTDDALAAAAMAITGSGAGPAVPAGWIEIAVAGAHLKGQVLEHQLTDRGAVWLTTTSSAPTYRLYALDSAPPKPALVHVGNDGAAIELDVWALAPAAFGDFVASIPPPLGVGTVDLADGRSIPGFISEPRATDGARDITEFEGWRAYRTEG